MIRNSQCKYIAYRYNKKIAEAYDRKGLSEKTGLSADHISAFKIMGELGFELVDLRPKGGIEVYDCKDGSKINEFKYNTEVAEYTGAHVNVVGRYCYATNKGYEVITKELEYDYVAYQGDDVLCVANSIEELSEGTGYTVETLRRYASHPNKDRGIEVYRYVREEEDIES